jgi:hypothetical protein
MSTRSVVAALVLTLSASCALPGRPPPGMREAQLRPHSADPSLVELARVDGSPNERPLLVIYPRSACSGSASGVLVDDRGHFLGAIAPGTAALLSIPADLDAITAFSSVEVTAPAGAWFATDRIAVPPLPGGLVLRSTQSSARQCNSGQYFDVTAASRGDLEEQLRESEVRWFEMRNQEEGQAWLDAHRARLHDLLGRRTGPTRAARR